MEAVIIVPVAMLVVLVATQMCLWARASSVVQSAAAEGDQAACDLGGSIQAGAERARQFLASAAPATVAGARVDVTQPVVGQIQVSVQGTAESILPWLHLGVSATRRGDVQGFRAGE